MEDQPVPGAPRFFAPAQMLVVSRLTDLIIPPTDTPGAAAAGVPAYIDLVVSGDPGLQEAFRAGLPRLDKMSQEKFSTSSFVDLAEAQQVEILTALSEDADKSFFRAIKKLTADGYYTSRVGLVQELGYNGDAYLAKFPEFSIPEH
jgi:hypothetical protein